MTIADLQQYVQEFSRERGFDQSSMEQRVLFLMTEVGEVTREVLQLSYHPEPERQAKIKADLGLEMFDVVWNLMDLANKLGIDLEQAFREKMAINRDRVW